MSAEMLRKVRIRGKTAEDRGIRRSAYLTPVLHILMWTVRASGSHGAMMRIKPEKAIMNRQKKSARCPVSAEYRFLPTAGISQRGIQMFPVQCPGRESALLILTAGAGMCFPRQDCMTVLFLP